MATIKYPHGEVAVLTAVPATITQSLTIIKISGLTEGLTVNPDLGSELPIGARVVLIVTQGATKQDVSFGANVVQDDLTGVASDVDAWEFVYDGSKLHGVSYSKVVNAA